MGLKNPDRWNQQLLSALAPVLSLLQDPRVNEIEVNAHDIIYAKGPDWPGHRRMDLEGWPNRNSFKVAMQSIAISSRRQISEKSPEFDGRLPGGERLNMTFPPCCENGSMNIRKFPLETMTLSKLEKEYGSIDGRVRALLEALVLAERRFLVSGPTNSGKTSLINALSKIIPEWMRVVTCEDSRELQILQPNWVPLETVIPWEAGQAEVKMRHLVKSSLRKTPDWLLIGEVRDEAAYDLAWGLNTGHKGGTSVHSFGGVDGFSQVKLLCHNAGSTMNGAELAELVARAFDVLIHTREFEDGSRKVTEVLEVKRPGVVVLGGIPVFQVRTLMKYRAAMTPAGDGKVRGIWTYPEEPSEELMEALRFKGLDWAQERKVGGGEREMAGGPGLARIPVAGDGGHDGHLHDEGQACRGGADGVVLALGAGHNPRGDDPGE